MKKNIPPSVSRIYHEYYALIFYYVPSSEDPYFIIANQRNIKPIMKETSALRISLCKKRYHQISFQKIGKGEESGFPKVFLKFSDRRVKQKTYLKVNKVNI